MCAICGWINEKQDLREKQNTFREMLDLMTCRGKDCTGYHFEEKVMLRT